MACIQAFYSVAGLLIADEKFTRLPNSSSKQSYTVNDAKILLICCDRRSQNESFLKAHKVVGSQLAIFLANVSFSSFEASGLLQNETIYSETFSAAGLHLATILSKGDHYLIFFSSTLLNAWI